jgi:hypothetical protein
VKKRLEHLKKYINENGELTENEKLERTRNLEKNSEKIEQLVREFLAQEIKKRMMLMVKKEFSYELYRHSLQSHPLQVFSKFLNQEYKLDSMKQVFFQEIKNQNTFTSGSPYSTFYNSQQTKFISQFLEDSMQMMRHTLKYNLKNVENSFLIQHITLQMGNNFLELMQYTIKNTNLDENSAKEVYRNLACKLIDFSKNYNGESSTHNNIGDNDHGDNTPRTPTQQRK